jgi:hypothetical protein
MRCVIARYPFELSRTGVLASMKGVAPELVTRESVTIGRRRYPVTQVGRVLTGQDPRDFTAAEVTRAMTRLGFTVHDCPVTAAVDDRGPVQAASALLGGTGQLAA